MSAYFETDEQRDAFLAEPRLAILLTNRTDNAPMGVPVWFEWDGEAIRMFAAKGTKKLTRIQKDPRISVLVTNHIGEREVWVAFDGTVEVTDGGTSGLIGRMAARYWDLTNPDYQATVEQWQQAEEMMVQLTLRPDRIRAGA